ncbi:Tn3 family transposase [Streptomyces mirabilis]|uniref:Tn3 family transposase n=1 Tax=Streptomyces mirabilis TaxID=68239 RepID=UPI0033AA16A2
MCTTARSASRNWNSANHDLFYGKDGDLTGSDKESQEVCMLALHLLQSALVHVNTLAEPPSFAVPGGPPHPWTAFDNTALSKDAREHTRMRRLTNRWLTPKMIGTWARLTHEFTVEALDRLTPGEVVDAHFDLGVLPTHLTMCRILDMPDWALRAGWPSSGSTASRGSRSRRWASRRSGTRCSSTRPHRVKASTPGRWPA